MACPLPVLRGRRQRPRATLPKSLLLVLLVLAGLAGAGGPAACDEEDLPEAAPGPDGSGADGAGEEPDDAAAMIAEVVLDPEGTATQTLQDVLRWMGRGDHAQAFQGLAWLLENRGDVLLPVSHPAPGERNLRLPCREVVERLWARLPVRTRAEAEVRWGGAAAARAARVRWADPASLARLGEDLAITATGRRALLALADLDLAAGRAQSATRRLTRLLALVPPDLGPAARAPLLVRLADARARMGDRVGVRDLAVRHPDALRERARVGGRDVSAGARIADDLAAAVAAVRPPPRAPEARPLAAPVAAWLVSLVDRGLLDEPADTRPVTTGAYATADEVVLHAGRSVLCLDPLTGLVRWRFPAGGPRGNDFAPWVRFERHDVPLRTVTPAGDLRLVVLGGPPGGGEFRWQGESRSMEREAQESRTRLVALDAASGSLRWATGLPAETDEVLGDPGTGCVSPPLVVGEHVYALFARRRGLAEIYLACLALRDGTPRWVRFVAAGDSGLSASTADRERFDSPRARAVPWGARPVLSGDEVLVVPHAGFAAGVDAGTGAVRWLRALPRHDPDLAPNVLYAFSARNEPLSHAGTWVLAPLDAPSALALERGTGRLRWRLGAADLGLPLRDLLGLVPGPEGGSRLLFAGGGAVVVDAQDPRRFSDAGPETSELGGVAGRTLPAGDALLRVESGVLWRLRAHVGEDALPREAIATLPEGVPADGDLHRLGEAWVITDDVAAAVVGERADLVAAARQAAQDPDPRRALAARALLGRLVGGGTVLADALRETAALSDPAVKDAVAAQAALFLAELLRLPEEQLAADRARLDPVIPWLVTLPVGRRGAACADAYLLLRSLGDGAAVVEHLDRWIAQAPVDLIPWGGAQVREDLVAGNFLAGLRGETSAAGALEAREQRHRHLVEAAREAGEEELREAIRRAARTSAADAGREVLVDRLVGAGRLAEAAAVAADLRLDPAPALLEGDLGALRRRGGDLLAREASWLARAGEGPRARALLATLAHAVGEGARDDEGTSGADLAERLKREHGWSPQAGPARALELWPEGLPEDGDARRALMVPAVVGPGAGSVRSEMLLARGLRLEVWDAAASRRLGHLSAEDEGWFGASLREADAWVPGGGILVTSLVARQPGDLAGTRPGDWILGWDGQPVAGVADFMNRVSRVPPGRETSVQVVRRGVEVLSRIRAGQRPVGDGRYTVDRAQVHAEADGRLLLPTRTGLLRVDLGAVEGTWVWRWEEPGVVRRAVVSGRDALLSIDRGAEPDLLVAVDIDRGVERWRRELPGSARWVSVEGSAVVARCTLPSTALVLDRHDGRPRFRVDVHERRYLPFRRTVPPAETIASCAGRLWTITPAGFSAQIAVRNGTTGALEWSSGYAPEGGVSERGYVDPSIAAEGVVSVITGRNSVRVLVPDPVGGAPLHDLPLAEDVMTRQAHYGPVDDESRVLVGGTTVFLLRNTGGRTRDGQGLYDPGASVVLLGLDWAHLPPRTTGEVPPGGVVLLLSHQRMMTGGGRRSPWVLTAEASLEGLLVFGGLFEDPPEPDRPECVWVPAFGDEPEGAFSRIAPLFHVRFGEEELTDLRFEAPARVGDRLFIPTDRGMKVLPVLRMGD